MKISTDTKLLSLFIWYYTAVRHLHCF